MSKVKVDTITLSFPGNWRVTKYDEWTFYDKHFKKICDGIKAIDVLAIDMNRVAWLIECKDYRVHQRTKSIDLIAEIRDKVLFSVSGLAAARHNANSRIESDMAKRFLKAKKLRIVLQLEQPRVHSRLYPRGIDISKVQLKLKTVLKSIDPHPLVVESRIMDRVGWSVV